jgi:DNA-binding response OmpR family regulator
MKKILVVEDEPAYLKLLHNQLAQNGYEVIDAPDGEKGLKLALAGRPDLILLDILLPKVNGLEMLKALRADSWGQQVPVFILTNVNKSGEISQGMNEKVSHYLIKSEIKLEDLLWSIKIALK